ncbi:unnamed protein product [Cuscuta epithymum]|uniref:Reverse transcriptase zinc-binding domain-containing protein n=1 Tax=Cuscuta epithymum TaxID=186058 RepID=A0AAV0CC45_9ASTE|nr:unnamed protein product [Cuscuta epithymum]
MLGKQGWKLLTEPYTLVGRVLKAKYFPASTFREAKSGCNPSFVWRSILAAQDVVVAGCRRRVGNGQSISVWKDSWLLGSGSGRVCSVRPQGIADMNVAAMLNEDGKSWNIRHINSIFNEEEALLIRSIPLSLNPLEDRYRWSEDAKGQYIVRSCYRKLVGNVQPRGWVGWTAVWRFRVPPKVKVFIWQLVSGILPMAEFLKRRHIPITGSCPICSRGEESTNHLFLECQTSKEVWKAACYISLLQVSPFEEWLQQVFSRLDEEGISKVIMLLWSIWKSRNGIVWRGESFSVTGVQRAADSLLKSWRAVHEGDIRLARDSTRQSE